MIRFIGDNELRSTHGKFQFEVDCRDGDEDAQRLLNLLAEIIAKGLMGPGVIQVPGR